MSAALATPARLTPAPVARPHIEIVSTKAQRKARPRVVYALAATAGLFAIFVAQLLMSIALSDGAYQIAALQAEHKELLRTEQALAEDLELLDSSQNLAAGADLLGMVPSSHPAFLYLSSGSVVGAPGVVADVTCDGSCNLVSNALLEGKSPSVLLPGDLDPIAGQPVDPDQAASQQIGLPAPVTH